MSKPFVSILMGSESDLAIMQAAADTLKQLQIDFEIKITSAHRTPAVTQQFISDAESRGCQVFIANGTKGFLNAGGVEHWGMFLLGCQVWIAKSIQQFLKMNP